MAKESAPAPGRDSLENKVKLFAELRRNELYVRRWKKYYLDRRLVTQGDARRIDDEAEGKERITRASAADQLNKSEVQMLELVYDFMAQKRHDQAAHMIARMAKLKRIAGREYTADMAEAQDQLAQYEKGMKKTLPHSVEAVRGQAILLGLQKGFVEELSKPSLQELAEYTRQGLTIGDFAREALEKHAKDVALVLSEDDRQEYLSGFPEARRLEVGAMLDYFASKSMHDDTVQSIAEKEQVKAIESRAKQELDVILGVQDVKSLPGILKLVSATLAQLDSFDSVHILDEAASLGLDMQNVIVKDDTPQERIKRWFKYARLLKEQSDVASQEANAGMIGMKYLALTQLPPRLFDFFLRKMVDTGFLTQNVLRFPTSDPDNKRFLHELITKHPSQFNTIIDTLSQKSSFSVATQGQAVLESLAYLHTALPKSFDAYFGRPARERDAFLRELTDGRSHLYENNLDPENGPVPLAEQIYMATEPVNMSYRRFQLMLARLEDRTKDLEKYDFPIGGYRFKIEAAAAGTAKLREGQVVDTEKLGEYRVLFDELMVPTGENDKTLSDALATLIKSGNSKERGPLLSPLLSLIADAPGRNEMLDAFKEVSPENSYAFILKLESLLEGAAAQEMYREKLGEFLGKNPAVAERLLRELQNPKRVEIPRRSINANVKQGFRLEFNVPEQITSTEDVASFLTAYIFTTALKADRASIATEKKKFAAPREKREQKNIDNLTAYVSKSKTSFFARAAVGICTLEDVTSWNNENYFHINIVEDNEHLRANIQAFVVRIAGRQSLLLRGINPSSTFLRRADVGLFCEEALKIARKFQQDNGLANIYISEQAEWHALSNRPEVSEYMQRKYIRSATEVTLPRPMRMSETVGVQTISKVYRIA